MGLHGLASVTIGVPDPGSTAAYYTDFGLTPGRPGVAILARIDQGSDLHLFVKDPSLVTHSV